MHKWKENYAIGVDSIDRAHKELFSVLNRVDKMVWNSGNTQWAVTESIKYFKNYVVKHFADEEAYMLSVGYSKYRQHKAVHDGMRDIIIPKIYSDVERARYSDGAVITLLDICGKWLSRHILGQDRDLVKWTGKPVPSERFFFMPGTMPAGRPRKRNHDARG